MSRTLKERLRSRDGLIAAWVCTGLAWGGVVALGLIAMARGVSFIESGPILGWLLIGVVAAAATVFAIMARRSDPSMNAVIIQVLLTAPLALLFVGGAMLFIGYDIYVP